MPSKIEDYALIGDCETAALVSRAGSIDWLCWPRFDSGACFAALLGSSQNGSWSLAPDGAVKSITRSYRKGTLILETEFETGEGAIRLVDFMPLRNKHSNLIRVVHGIRGRVAMKMILGLRFDYGQSVPWVTKADAGALRGISGPNMVVLRTPVATHGENLLTVAEFQVSEGETIPFVLTYAPSSDELPDPVDWQQSFDETEQFWLDWTSQCTYSGAWADAVARSLITLKALTYWPTGGVLAAPTTSLPEKIGGARNWDYRFCWLRDATFTLRILMGAGYFQEAGEWQNWLLRAAAGSPDQVQTLYGVEGERLLPEVELPWLSGYEDSKPVRIGNAASEQLQLDVYGELANALHHAREGKLPRNEPAFQLESALLDHLEQIWREPDEGIWEVRGPRRHFTYSKVMAWVAFDRAIKSREQFDLEGPVDRWRAVRDEIHESVCRGGFDSDRGSFVQSYGSKNVDGSLLMIPIVGFLPADDPRVQGTVRAIGKDLLRGGFVLRYRSEETDDGLSDNEAAFLPCSFWLVDVYVLMGRLGEAKNLFENLLRVRNDVGLLSEEYDPAAKRLLGNFPQAFSHVALVSSVFHLNAANASLGK